jgi:Poxvirus A32 protein
MSRKRSTPTTRIEIKKLSTSKHEKEKKDIHPSLFQRPFFAGNIGPRHSGKSNLLKNMLQKTKGFYGKSFGTNICLFSTTYSEDDTLHDLEIPNVYEEESEFPFILNHILQFQEKQTKEGNQLPVLLIFEDVTKMRGVWPILEQLAYTGRHKDIHVIYNCHKLSSIPRGVRTQTQQFCLFAPHEESEFQWYLDMLSRRSTQKIWSQALLRLFAEPYSFLTIDYERKSLADKLRKGFNEPFFTPEELQVVGICNQHEPEESVKEEELYSSSDEEDPIIS